MLKEVRTQVEWFTVIQEYYDLPKEELLRRIREIWFEDLCMGIYENRDILLKKDWDGESK